jgi:hypothetical protein
MSYNQVSEAEEIRDQAIKTITEFEFNLFSHPEHEREDSYFVDFKPPTNDPDLAEEKIYSILDDAADIGQKAEKIGEKLEGEHERTYKRMNIIETRTAKLVLEATQILGIDDYRQWAVETIDDSDLKQNNISGFEYKPSRRIPISG